MGNGSVKYKYTQLHYTKGLSGWAGGGGESGGRERECEPEVGVPEVEGERELCQETKRITGKQCRRTMPHTASGTAPCGNRWRAMRRATPTTIAMHTSRITPHVLVRGQGLRRNRTVTKLEELCMVRGKGMEIHADSIHADSITR